MQLDHIERNISHLTANTVAFVLAGGRGSRLMALTEWRAKPGVPFGGKFRIIDFPLSNCINSGIRRISVVTQYKSHSLQRHLQRGWSFLSGQFGEFLEVLPAQQRQGEGWYEGTADAVYQNLDIIREYDPEYIIILAGDHIYKMDYGKMIAAHVARGADITVGCIPVLLEEASEFGVMAIDDDPDALEYQPADYRVRRCRRELRLQPARSRPVACPRSYRRRCATAKATRLAYGVRRRLRRLCPGATGVRPQTRFRVSSRRSRWLLDSNRPSCDLAGRWCKLEDDRSIRSSRLLFLPLMRDFFPFAPNKDSFFSNFRDLFMQPSSRQGPPTISSSPGQPHDFGRLLV